jgi:hypothetical protein
VPDMLSASWLTVGPDLRQLTGAYLPRPAASFACVTSAPARTRPRPTARPSGSSRRSGANGPMRCRTAAPTPAPPICPGGYATTTASGPMLASLTRHLPPGSRLTPEQRARKPHLAGTQERQTLPPHSSPAAAVPGGTASAPDRYARPRIVSRMSGAGRGQPQETVGSQPLQRVAPHSQPRHPGHLIGAI